MLWASLTFSDTDSSARGSQSAGWELCRSNDRLCILVGSVCCRWSALVWKTRLLSSARSARGVYRSCDGNVPAGSSVGFCAGGGS